MKILLSIFMLVIVTGCSTMQPPRYSVSVDNVQALKKFEDAQLMVSDMAQSAKFSANCRLMGPIEPADGLTIPEFVKKAFNDELKMANIYSEGGTKLTGDISKISFSSMSPANWDITMLLNSSNGNSLEVSNKLTFKSGFDAITACNASADALSPAIQDLIQKAVTDPKFKDLL